MNDQDQTDTTAADNTVTLETPLQRGDQQITRITLRKPRAGELRGVTLTDLLQMDVAALQTILPRITSPALFKPEISALDPADLVQMGTKVSAFLVPKAMLTEAAYPGA